MKNYMCWHGVDEQIEEITDVNLLGCLMGALSNFGDIETNDGKKLDIVAMVNQKMQTVSKEELEAIFTDAKQYNNILMALNKGLLTSILLSVINKQLTNN